MGSEGTLTVATASLSAGDPRASRTEFAAQACVLLREDARVESLEARPDSRFRLRVTASGFDSEWSWRRRLFEPFFTTKANGTGLGLAITERIVKEHDGFITLVSEPGRGCEFQLFFPAPAA